MTSCSPCHAIPDPTPFETLQEPEEPRTQIERSGEVLELCIQTLKVREDIKKGLPSPQIRHQDFLLTEVSKSSPSLQKIGNVPLRTMKTALKTL